MALSSCDDSDESNQTDRNLVNIVITGDDIKDSFMYTKEKIPAKARGLKSALKKKLLVQLGAVEVEKALQTAPQVANKAGVASEADEEASESADSELDSDDEFAGRYNSRRIKAGPGYRI